MRGRRRGASGEVAAASLQKGEKKKVALRREDASGEAVMSRWVVPRVCRNARVALPFPLSSTMLSLPRLLLLLPLLLLLLVVAPL